MKHSELNIEALVRQKLDGESYSQIRAHLAEEGYNEEEIRATIREVDNRVLLSEVEKGSTERAKTWYRAGLALAVTGLLITIASNAGWILPRAPRWSIYAPFFLGIVLMYYGRYLRQKQPEPLGKGPGRIRTKRPYK